MELKQIDHKIISYLFHHTDEPISKIAKALKLSRDQVDYRIKRYLDDGIIIKFMTIFDYSQLGYNCFAGIFLKFENNSFVDKFVKKLPKRILQNPTNKILMPSTLKIPRENNKTGIIQTSQKHKNIISFGRCLGKYDVWMNVIFKDENEMSNFLAELSSDSDLPLHDSFVMKHYFAELYPLKTIIHSSEIFPIVEESSKPKRKFSDKEIEILKMLEKNSRESLVNIASKINSSAELTLYKIRKLKQDKVIVGTRMLFDFKKLGYFGTALLINLPNLSKNNKEKMKMFARNSNYVISFSLFFSRPNCFLQILHRNEKELRDTIKDLQETFKNEMLEIEILPVFEDEYMNTLPFL